MKLFIYIFLLLSINSALLADVSVNLINKLVASDRDESYKFGWSVDIDGDYAIVGSIWEDPNEIGAAYIFEKDGNGDWVQVQKIVASDRRNNDEFGRSVSISGNYAIVGAAYNDYDENDANFLVNNPGAAYIFERVSGTWTQVQKIVASDRAIGDYFGWNVSISGDYLIVGSYWNDLDENGGDYVNRAGAAYIFERDGNGDWNQVNKIVNSDREEDDSFGWSVAISGDYAVVGAPNESHDKVGNNYVEISGSAYVFERDGNGDWSEVDKIVASDRRTLDEFGWSVDIDGDYIVVGAYKNDYDENDENYINGNTGSAYIFKRESGTWTQTQKIVASDRGDSDFFSESVMINGDYIIVGAFKESHDENGLNTLSNAGSSYLFIKDENGDWNESNKFVANDRKVSAFFGNSVAVSNDFVIIGAYGEDYDNNNSNFIDLAGAAYIFEINNPSAPSITSLSLVDVYNNSATLTSTIDINQSTATYTYEYGTSTGNYSATTSAQEITANGSATVVLSGLDADDEYFVRVRAENSIGVSYSSEYSFVNTNEPQNHTSTFTLARNEITQLVFNIEAAEDISADGYIILYKQGTTFTGEPENGENYSVGGTIGDATIGAIITDATALNATVANLTKQTEYHFKIYPFNWNGSDITSAVYKTDGTVPSLTVVTVPTLGEWGMIAFVGLMAIGGVFYIRKRIV